MNKIFMDVLATFLFLRLGTFLLFLDQCWLIGFVIWHHVMLAPFQAKK